MGKYIAFENPEIDILIEGHMDLIVKEITSRMKPESIILRGSFGRGEGSIIQENGKLIFLSDYEIDVMTKSPLHRALFAELSSRLSDQLGLQVGIRWMRPDCLERDRIGPFLVGKAKPSISLYEFRYGSKVLWGRDIFRDSPLIDPASIQLESGITLLLNRMAESLIYMKPDNAMSKNEYSRYYWINKTILACAESLLLLWGQYHFSYRERGNRFLALGQNNLKFMPDQEASFLQLVEMATEFKLRPRNGVYQESPEKYWHVVLPICEKTLRHIMEEGFLRNYQNLEKFPESYLSIQNMDHQKRWNGKSLLVKMMEIYRAMKSRQFSTRFSLGQRAYKIVYSAVPLIFLTYDQNNNLEVLNSARNQITRLVSLEKPSTTVSTEWEYLRRQIVALWKVYCY